MKALRGRCSRRCLTHRGGTAPAGRSPFELGGFLDSGQDIFIATTVGHFLNIYPDPSLRRRPYHEPRSSTPARPGAFGQGPHIIQRGRGQAVLMLVGGAMLGACASSCQPGYV
jgi:hypothetical protein